MIKRGPKQGLHAIEKKSDHAGDPIFVLRERFGESMGLIQKRVSQMPLVVLIQRQSFRCFIRRVQAADRGPLAGKLNERRDPVGRGATARNGHAAKPRKRKIAVPLARVKHGLLRVYGVG